MLYLQFVVVHQALIVARALNVELGNTPTMPTKLIKSYLQCFLIQGMKLAE